MVCYLRGRIERTSGKVPGKWQESCESCPETRSPKKIHCPNLMFNSGLLQVLNMFALVLFKTQQTHLWPIGLPGMLVASTEKNKAASCGRFDLSSETRTKAGKQSERKATRKKNPHIFLAKLCLRTKENHKNAFWRLENEKSERKKVSKTEKKERRQKRSKLLQRQKNLECCWKYMQSCMMHKC